MPQPFVAGIQAKTIDTFGLAIGFNLTYRPLPVNEPRCG